MSRLLSFVAQRPGFRSAIHRIGIRFPRLYDWALRQLADLRLSRSGGLRRGGRQYDPARPTILLCVHEGSLTGAPILGWNLARQLSTSYNLVGVLLRGGPLAPALAAQCCAYVEPPLGSIADADAGAFRRKIITPARDRFKLSGVIANSIECEVAATAARLAALPAVALIHEFAAYTATARLTRMVESGARLVFSSQLQRQSIERAIGRPLDEALVHPQGKCQVPPTASRASGSLDDLLRKLTGRGTFLCVGLGLVQPRKGVDLFLAAAIEVLRRGVDAHFLWVGDGYDPVGDFQVGVWLKAQIDISGFADRLSIAPSVDAAALERLYDRADAMFLSSRLDPLPNVAIDALWAGVPVVCFDSGTGLAEYLREDELLADLVVPYFDIGAAATALAALAADRERRMRLADRAAALAHDRFDPVVYARYVVHALGDSFAWRDTS